MKHCMAEELPYSVDATYTTNECGMMQFLEEYKVTGSSLEYPADYTWFWYQLNALH